MPTAAIDVSSRPTITVSTMFRKEPIKFWMITEQPGSALTVKLPVGKHPVLQIFTCLISFPPDH